MSMVGSVDKNTLQEYVYELHNCYVIDGIG